MVQANGCTQSQDPTIDSDADGVFNSNDKCPNTPVNAQVDSEGCLLDQDSDGLTDVQEAALETDPTSKDTDGDGLEDGAEVASGNNPLDPDSDDDGIEDGADHCVNTDISATPNLQGCAPYQLDTDSDTINDRDDQCPLTSESEVAHVNELGCGFSERDTDGDGLTDAEEIAAKTNIAKADTDEDGVSDADEVKVHNTNPLQADTDGDTLTDGFEIARGLNPLSQDTDGDTLLDADDQCPLSLANQTVLPNGCAVGDDDSDGIDNNADKCAATPTGLTVDTDGCSDDQRDTDQDGIVDINDAFPTDIRESNDLDGDGIGDNSDTDRDGDGVSNTDELQAGSNPNDPLSVPSDSNISLAVLAPANGSTVDVAEQIIRGEFISDQPAQSMRIIVQGPIGAAVEALVNSTDQNTLFTYSAPITLSSGLNTLIVQATANFIDGDPDNPTVQTIERRITLDYQPPITANAPTLNVLGPVDGAFVSEASFYLTADYAVYEGKADVTVNGESVTLNDLNKWGTFDTLLSFAEGQESLSFTIELTDGQQTTQRSMTVYRDIDPPTITLDNALLPGSVVNTVNEQPYPISGSVSEANLASFSVNDQPVTLNPTADPSVYSFSFWVSPTANNEYPLDFYAVDVAGNSTPISYTLTLNATVSLNMMLPPANTVLMHTGTPLTLQVAARSAGSIAGLAGRAVVLNAQGSNVAEQALSASGEMFDAILDIPPVAGTYTIQLLLEDASGQQAAKTSRTVEVQAQAAVALEVLSLTPADNAQFITPNEPISVAFNLPIDPALLKIEVNETAHGNTYIRATNEPPETIVHKGYQLQRVDRDFTPVLGGLAPAPGNRLVSFFTQNWLAYNADVFVNVLYDADADGQYESLSRTQFKTRPLPTFISGGVVDQLGQHVVGVKVSLPELKRTTTTNSDGTFSFGFGDSPATSLPAGRHLLEINPNLENPVFGNRRLNISVTAGQSNSLHTVKLPVIGKNNAYTPVGPHSNTVVLAKGSLQLDVADAEFTFPDGSSQGALLSQFTRLDEISEPLDPDFNPPWYFATFPQGVEISKAYTISLTLPEFDGSYDYVPAHRYYMLLMATDPLTGVISPKGVGQLSGHQIISLRHQVTSLNHIGVAYIPQQYEHLAQSYIAGDLNLQEFIIQLRQAIRSVRNGTTTLAAPAAQ